MADNPIITVSSPLVAWFQHNLVRTIGVVIIGTLLIVLPIFLMYSLYQKGVAKGKDSCPPQQVYTAPCTQNYITNPPTGYAAVGISTKNWCFGICHK